MSKSAKRVRTTRDAVEILDRLTGPDLRLRRMIEHAALNAEVARLIFDARASAGISQQELARLVGTTQSVIARLEDADYQGHSLAMLRRIAGALGCRVQVRFVKSRTRSRAA